MSNEGSASRAISPRFASASSERSSAPAVSPEKAAEITAWAERTTARAEYEFRQNREEWTNKQYGELLARDGERMSLQPAGATDDREAHLMRAAEHIVHRGAHRSPKPRGAAGGHQSRRRKTARGRNAGIEKA